MADLSSLARLVLTLLVSALSLFLYKRMQSSSPSSPASPPPPASLSSSVKRSKKRSKKPKKAATKAAAVDDSSKSETCAAEPDASVAVIAISLAAEDDDEASESDSDEGLSAAQVLATRRFQPKRLGGTIQAASKLPEGAPRFTAGQDVLARFRGEERWFPARVLERRKGNEYHLKYDDGEVEYRVPAKFIKLQVATTAEDEGTSEERAAAQAVVAEAVTNEVVVQPKEETGSDSSSSTSEDDGWQVVGTSKAVKKRQVQQVQMEAQAEPLIDGLTKRQRENRRKKERQREKKELLRQHAQKDDLDARARWRYMPS
uniref:Agenet domain-containing protein n=1 Tax=Hyaloperonospora arabidopsidis (strain Emoy2) TaxID=559515 RepID=M4C0G8_HYAAE